MAQARMARGKAVGTRDRVVAWLAANGDVHDPLGMASTALARHIGYPGTSTAFAQLLSGMERSGLIWRDIRGKRTYRVTLIAAGWRRAQARGPEPDRPRTRRASDDDRARSSSPSSPSSGSSGSSPSSGRRDGSGRRRDGALDEVAGVLDYDALAHRILVQVARRLATSTGSPGTAPAVESTVLDGQVSALKAELQSARANRAALEQENMELRAQLERIRRSLEEAAPRRRRAEVAMADEPIDPEDGDVALLQRVLADSSRSARRRSGNASTA